MFGSIAKLDYKKEYYRLMALLMVALILLRDLGGININKFIYVGLAGICFFMLNKYEIYAFLAFLTPIYSGISYSYIALVALIIIVVKYGRFAVDVYGVCGIMGILLIELFSVVYGDWIFIDFLKFASILLICFYRMLDEDDNYDNKRIIDGYLMGMVVALVSIFGQMVLYFGWNAFLNLNFALIRIGNLSELTGKIVEGQRVMYNANGLCTLCIQSVLLCFIRYNTEKRWRYVMLSIVCLAVGMMTLSRKFIIVGVAFIFAYLLLNRNKGETTVGSVFKVAIGVIVSVVIFNTFLVNSAMGLLDRFKVNDLSNGRIDIMNFYFEKMFQNPERLALGVGLQNYMLKYGSEYSCHNAIQEILVTWGFVGFALVLFLIIRVLLNVDWKKYNLREKAIYLLPFLSELVCAQFSQGFYDMLSMFRLMVMFSAIKLLYNEKRQVLTINADKIMRS